MSEFTHRNFSQISNHRVLKNKLFFNMPHILKNKTVEIHIDAPLEGYQFSRFDWTGKITKVKFKNIVVSTVEDFNAKNEHLLGKGFYNEFGIDNALGFEETEIGGWFHKIGIGLLKKEDNTYSFNKNYEIKPANFKVSSRSNQITITCKSELINGYSYLLKKEIVLSNDSFTIHYSLENTGKKNIVTEEYVHNFIGMHQDAIGSNYHLKFPFQLQPTLFGETVNPELKVNIGNNNITLNGSPKEQFFFSNLSGDKKVEAEWELIHTKKKVGIRETGNFQTNKINLWGWKHVISPELFYPIFIKPNDTKAWSRTYTFCVKK